MRFVLYTNVISPHQLPLARAVARHVGGRNFLYVSESLDCYVERVDTVGLRVLRADDPETGEWLENADVLYTGGLRPIDLLERRAKRGLKTHYYSERWFKPVSLFDLRLFDCLIHMTVPGWVRMFVPWYRRMAKRFVKLANENSCVKFLPVGPWARRDFLRLGVRADKLVDWGYFVEKGRGKRERGTGSNESDNLKSNNQPVLRLLWVGRMIGWKRAETIVRAANEFKVQSSKFKVTLVGDGPEKGRLMRLAKGVGERRTVGFAFLPRQPLEKVRELMRGHDLFVLASDAQEGWGAVVNEALEEGMNVLGTFEAGASAAMLPKERLHHAGDAKALATLILKELRGELPPCSIGDWTAEKAAERLLGL